MAATSTEEEAGFLNMKTSLDAVEKGKVIFKKEISANIGYWPYRQARY